MLAGLGKGRLIYYVLVNIISLVNVTCSIFNIGEKNH